MPKYKFGDVAALFPKPKESTTESGKKLQSLFSEFHTKRNKPLPESQPQHYRKIKAENKNFGHQDKEVSGAQSVQTERNKKRKFEFSDVESNIEKVMKKINLELDGPMQADTVKVKERGKNSSLSEIDFPRRLKKEGKFNLNFKRGVTEDSPTNQKNKFNKISKVSGPHQTVTEDSLINQKNKFNKTSEINDRHQVKGFIKKAKHQGHNFANDEIKSFEFANTENTQSSKGKMMSRNVPQQAKGFIKKAKHQNRKLSNDAVKNFDHQLTKINTPQQAKGFIKKHQNHNGSNDAIENFETADTENLHTPKYEVVNNNSLLGIKSKKQGVKKPKKKKVNNAANKLEFINEPDVKNDPNEPDFVKLSHTKKLDDEETLSHTLFVGNLPTNMKRKVLFKLFSAFGPVERVRYHPIEMDRKKIFQSGGRLMSHLNYAATSIPAFVTFKEKEHAVNALALTGSLLENRHINVDFALPPGTKKVYDNKRSIFIGNLPFTTQEENIWNAFAECGKVECVRVVRDKMTGIGKGFGYVLFTSIQAKEKALALENVEIEGRTIRIKAVETNKKAQRQYKKDPISFKNTDSFKSRAINFKKSHQDTSSRKSVKKIMKKNKAKHHKKTVASMLQKSWK